MGSFALGSSVGWTNPNEPEIKEGVLGFKVSNEEYAWVGSCLHLGAASVCIPIGIIINIIGRKNTMLCLVPPFLLSWTLILCASNVAMLLVGRFILGMCGGAFCITAPLYTTEIAQTKIRGILGCFFQMLFTSGVLYAYVTGTLFGFFTNSLFCAAVPLTMGVLFLLLPESPVFYVKKGKIEKAEKSMYWLRGKDYDITDEMINMIANEEYASQKKATQAKSLFNKGVLRAFVISSFLLLFQQFSGVNAIVMYSTEMFRDAETGLLDKTCTVLVGTMMLLAAFTSLFFIDRVGRRPLLLLSSFFMTFATFGVGFYFFKKEHDAEFAKSISWLPVLCCCLYVISFAFGFGPIPWLIMAEVFSADVKGVASSIVGTINWSAAFTVTKTYPIISRAIGVGGTFWIFSSITVIAFFFVLIVVPETKGRTFLEIQNMLQAK